MGYLISFFYVVGGLILLAFPEKVAGFLFQNPEYFKQFSKLFHELGLALIIAQLVSYLFDFRYHKSKFLDPIDIIHKENKKLFNKVTSFNQLLGYSEGHNITSIFGRWDKDKREIKFWEEKINEVIGSADDYLLIIARSLDTLTKFDGGILTQIEDALICKKNLRVSILLANTFDDETVSEFREECKFRSENGEKKTEALLFTPTRDTVVNFLELIDKGKFYDRVSVTLTNKSPPFAMFMTEEKAIIEPYLPLIEGGESIIFTVESHVLHNEKRMINHIYKAYIVCYSHILDRSKLASEVIGRYISKHEVDNKPTEKKIIRGLTLAKEMDENIDDFKKTINKHLKRYI